MSEFFPTLFSPLTIRNIQLKNRILSTGHDTSYATDGRVNERLVAYHRARAAGGAGLIISQVAAVHASAFYTAHCLAALDDSCIDGYRALAEACHEFDCRVFGQLFHPGREVIDLVDGAATVAYAPSASPSERFHVMPRALSSAVIAEIVAGYGDAALRMKTAGLDGVEIVASHGYLPAQFLNPRVNVRTDEYGGDFSNRLRFLREVISAIRAKVGDFVVGMRICGDEKDEEGLKDDEAFQVCEALDGDGELDYFNVIAGTSSSLGGAIHIVPPMAIETGYVAPYAATLKTRVSKPVFVAGRINQPQIAETILSTGQADVCGMTRAMICDPEIGNKAKAGRLDDIRACIACNQACIGHFHMGVAISCIQHPETGRELLYGSRPRVQTPKRIMVIGGGPGGMKAAAVAAERGHHVTLYEKSTQLGGQTLLAQLLPGRSEFGGIVTNLTREMALAGVQVVKGVEATEALIAQENPDHIIVATGARARWPHIEGVEDGHVVDAWQVLKEQVNVGSSVAIADWRADWIGIGLAEKLARDGCRVRLYVNANMAGETIHRYVRDEKLGLLSTLGVEVVPMVRLYGVDESSVYFQHVTSGEAMVAEEVDTLVLAQGHVSIDELGVALENAGLNVSMVGDCLTPRTAEEAVLEGLKVGFSV